MLNNTMDQHGHLIYGELEYNNSHSHLLSHETLVSEWLVWCIILCYFL